MRRLAVLAAISAAALAPATAFAHTGAGHLGGFGAGVAHPLFGLDHLLAMVGVGLWAARLGRAGHPRALWAVPLAFLGAMVLGGVTALAGLALPATELGIAGSVVLLGLLIAASSRFSSLVPTGAAMALVAAFAIFHGHAHGLEMPAAAHPLAYAGGFLAASAALHGLGVALGLAALRLELRGVRLAGAAMALAGVWMVAAV
jgi:urease accessory protein